MGDPIVVEETFHAPPSRVWKAITDRDEMSKWYFELASFVPEVGFEFTFEGGTENRKYMHLCRITEVIPQKRISYTWVYEGFSGESVVTFELIPQGNDSKVRLTHSGLETFPSDNPDFARENFVAGWDEIIHSNLKKHIEKD